MIRSEVTHELSFACAGRSGRSECQDGKGRRAGGMGLQRGVLEGPRETGLECLPGHHVITFRLWAAGFYFLITNLMTGLYSDLRRSGRKALLKVNPIDSHAR